MGDPISLLLFAGGTIFGVLAAHFGRRDRRVLRQKRVAIAKLGDNERRRIGGTIRALDGTSTAALTGRPCVYFQVYIRNSVDGEPGDVVIAEYGGVPFVVADDTGTAIIDPRGAELHRMYEVAAGRTSQFEAARVDAILARHGYPQPDRGWRSRLYLFETILAAGDEVDVVGAGIREPDPDGASDGYRTTPTRIRMAATEKSPLSIVKSRRV